MKTPMLAMLAVLAATMAMMAMDAAAQFGGGMGGGRRGARMDRGSSSSGSNRLTTQESVASLVEYRLALLQEDLHLTRDQEGLWAPYEDRVKALAADIMRERERAQSATLSSAVDLVNHAVDTARNRLAAWEDIASASRALYDGLTPQQKTLADQRFPSIVHELAGVRVASDPGPRSLATPTPK